jgi:hypothetical protein
MADLSGHVATVSTQEGDRVLVSIPMVGFPKGFMLQKGDRVAVVQSERGAIALPLVRSVEASPGVESVDDYRITDATVESGEGNRTVLFVVERDAGAEGASQVFAIRRDA